MHINFTFWWRENNFRHFYLFLNLRHEKCLFKYESVNIKYSCIHLLNINVTFHMHYTIFINTIFITLFFLNHIKYVISYLFEFEIVPFAF